MRHVSWATFYEGPSDALYFDVLLPRVIQDVVASDGVESVNVPDIPAVKLGARGRSVQGVAEEACQFAEAYDIVFIHADTGGRALSQTIVVRADAYCVAMTQTCNRPVERCITITPTHETEAWLLADCDAVTQALGYRGSPAEVGLPRDALAAERLADPKQVLRTAIQSIAGRRRGESVENIFPAIAQRQRLDRLRRSSSFRSFEERLRLGLRHLRCIK